MTAESPSRASPYRFSDLRQSLASLLEKNWLRCLILVVAGFCVHLPALPGERIWDDEFLTEQNPFIKSPVFVFEVFRHHLFLDHFAGHYRPVQNLSYMVDYFFWADNTYGFHLSNVSLHVASGLLLYFLLRRLAASFYADASVAAAVPRLISGALFSVALLWMVHPVHSAAVDYLSGRADSLAFGFASAGWLLFLNARDQRKEGWRRSGYVAALLCGLFSLCAREIGCAWIVVFLLHTWCCDKVLRQRGRIAVTVVCLALVAAYAALRSMPDDRPMDGPSHEWTVPTKLVLMARALGDYTRLMVFPSNLYMERTVMDAQLYQGNKNWREAIGTEYLSLLGLAFAAVLAAGCAWRSPGRVLRVAGAVWFLVGYLPISNAFELIATVAEHWLYFPSVGFLLFGAGVVIDLPKRLVRLAPVAVIVFATALSARSFVRSSDWVDPETFYTRTVYAGGGSTRVCANLGNILASKGEYAAAEKIFRRVLVMSPDYHIAKNNLADVCLRQGKTAEAEAILAEAANSSAAIRREYPRTWKAAVNLAIVLKAENPQAALAVLARARLQYPNVWEIISLQAELLRRTNRTAEAIGIVEEYEARNWWHYGANLALGRLYTELGDITKAERTLRHASRLDVHEVEGLNMIVRIKLRHHQLEQAHAMQRRALSRQPNQPRQYLLLAEVLQQMGRVEEAKATLAQLGELKALAVAAN